MAIDVTLVCLAQNIIEIMKFHSKAIRIFTIVSFLVLVFLTGSEVFGTLNHKTEVERDTIVDPEFRLKLKRATEKGIPLNDLHVHLKGGLTEEQALSHAGKYGFTYGIAYNSGLKMGFESDDSLQTFVRNYVRPKNSYLAMQ